jgi:hypothetical protein
MVRVLVVYESMFGNTERIARAVGAGLAAPVDGLPGHDVEVIEVGAAPDRLGRDVDLLVAGAPTHAFGLSRPSTRRDSVKSATGPLVSTGRGLREWIAGLEAEGTPRVAVFDTRMGKPAFLRFTPHGSRVATKLLRARGLPVSLGADHFWVTDTTGPLAAGEEERARTWGATLGAAVAAR